MPEGPSLVQRGLLLLGGLTALLAIVGIVFWVPRGPAGPSGDAAPPSATPSPTGWEVRYNAAVSLACRGSKDVPFDTLREILDESQQMANFQMKTPDGKMIPDEAAARRTMIVGLKAVADWNKHPEALKALGADNPNVKQLREVVDKLAQNPNLAVKKEAEATRATFNKV